MFPENTVANYGVIIGKGDNVRIKNGWMNGLLVVLPHTNRQCSEGE